jgi:hypothetical protein
MFGVLAGTSTVVSAQETRTPVSGVDKGKDGSNLTPVSLCVPATLRFVSHTRKGLKLNANRYCRDREWVVRQLERDRNNIFWYVPFSDGTIYCVCKAR